jgi:hypothetical protein
MLFGFEKVERPPLKSKPIGHSTGRWAVAMSLIQLIYVSAETQPFTDQTLKDLLKVSRENNANKGITGLLLYRQGSFFQVLEGEEKEVNALFEKISYDPRHDRILLLKRIAIETPNFANWTMGFLNLRDSHLEEMPGFVDFFKQGLSFLDLKGDFDLVQRLLEGFRDGRWRRHVEKD